MNKEKEIFENWLSSYILKLNLCPFAHRAINQNRIDFVKYKPDEESFVFNIFNEFLINSPHDIESCFLLIPEVPTFNDFLDVLYLLEDIIDENIEFQNIKLVGFHPEYMHGQVSSEIEHFTNRCPLALIQLINKLDIDKRTKLIPVKSILSDNLKTLEKEGKTKLNEILYELT